MSELKPCPFCVNLIPNNRPIVIWDSSGHSVGCKNCGAHGPNTDTASQAIETWNERSTQSAPSVGSVPSDLSWLEGPTTWVFSIDEGEGDHDVDFVRKEDYDNAVALLTRRMEGK